MLFRSWETSTGKLVTRIPLRRGQKAYGMTFVGEHVIYAGIASLWRIDLKSGQFSGETRVDGAVEVLLLSSSKSHLYVGTDGGRVAMYALPAADITAAGPTSAPASRPEGEGP